MTDGDHMRLSSGEIYTLAAMLGYSSVVGVEENTIRSWGADLRRHVRSNVEKLERKKLIECGMQGELKIEPKLRAMIACLGEPKRALLLSGNLRAGRRGVITALKGERGTVTLCNLDEDTYKLRLLSEYDPTDMISAFLDGAEAFSLKERLLSEDAAYIREKALSFDDDEAKRRLLACVHDENAADYLLSILTGRAKTLEIRLLRRENGCFADEERVILAAADGRAVKIKADESGMIYFYGVEPKEFLSKLKNSCFRFKNQNGGNSDG